MKKRDRAWTGDELKAAQLEGIEAEKRRDEQAMLFVKNNKPPPNIKAVHRKAKKRFTCHP